MARVTEEVKRNVRSILISNPKGVKIHQFPRDYRTLLGHNINFKALGYNKVIEFMEALPDVAKIEWSAVDQDYRIFAVTDGDLYLPSALKRGTRPIQSRSKQVSPGLMQQWQKELIPNLKGQYAVSLMRAPGITREDISDDFATAGEIAEVSMTQKYVFVRYNSKEEALNALEKLYTKYNLWVPIERMDPHEVVKKKDAYLKNKKATQDEDLVEVYVGGLPRNISVEEILQRIDRNLVYQVRDMKKEDRRYMFLIVKRNRAEEIVKQLHHQIIDGHKILSQLAYIYKETVSQEEESEASFSNKVVKGHVGALKDLDYERSSSSESLDTCGRDANQTSYTAMSNRPPGIPPLEPVIPDLEPALPDLEPALPDLEPALPDLEPVLPDLEPALPDLEPVRHGHENTGHNWNVRNSHRSHQHVPHRKGDSNAFPQHFNQAGLLPTPQMMPVAPTGVAGASLQMGFHHAQQPTHHMPQMMHHPHQVHHQMQPAPYNSHHQSQLVHHNGPAAHHNPLAGHHKPPASHHNPSAGHHNPLAAHHNPSAGHHNIHTGHHNPLTMHNGRQSAHHRHHNPQSSHNSPLPTDIMYTASDEQRLSSFTKGTGLVHVENFAPGTRWEMLKDFFGGFRVEIDPPEPGRNSHAVVFFKTRKQAMDSVKCDGVEFNGRRLNVYIQRAEPVEPEVPTSLMVNINNSGGDLGDKRQVLADVAHEKDVEKMRTSLAKQAISPQVAPAQNVESNDWLENKMEDSVRRAVASCCPGKAIWTPSDLSGEMVDIMFTHVVDDMYMWGQVIDPETQTELTWLMEMTPEIMDEGNHMDYTIGGKTCIAMFDDEWFRGCVMEVKRDTASVFSLDYGNTVKVPQQDLRDLPVDFWEVTAQVWPIKVVSSECKTGHDLLHTKVRAQVLNKDNESPLLVVKIMELVQDEEVPPGVLVNGARKQKRQRHVQFAI